MQVISNLNFIKKQHVKPYYESSAITGLVPKLHFKLEKKQVKINSIRNKKKAVLDKDGFELHNYYTPYNEYNILQNLERYKRELEKICKQIFGYKEIFIFDLTIRSNKKKGAYNIDGRRQPADRVHVDYTIKSGPKRAKEVIGINKYNNALKNKRRIVQFNAWRPLCNEVKSSPLTFADPSSINQKDLIATDQIFPKRIGEIYHLAYNRFQKWYWVPNMKRDEILLIKGWDSSDKKNVVKFTPHAAFSLKNENIIKYPRTSIEARIFLIL